MSESLPLAIKELTPERWVDFERLFGPRCVCAGCWCMYMYRELPNADFKALAYQGTKAAQEATVRSSCVPGSPVYAGGEAVGWIAVEPRRAYLRLANSRVLKPVDAQPVWSVTCFFTRRDMRGRGVSVALLNAAIQHGRRRAGRLVEGYPMGPGQCKLPAPFAYTGLASAFRRAGFAKKARRSPTHPIFRHAIGG
jgi:GNAT superfamily N-acetyltransferase